MQQIYLDSSNGDSDSNSQELLKIAKFSNIIFYSLTTKNLLR